MDSSTSDGVVRRRGGLRSLDDCDIMLILPSAFSIWLNPRNVVESPASVSMKAMICDIKSNPFVPPPSRVFGDALHWQADDCLSDLGLTLQPNMELTMRDCAPQSSISFCDILKVLIRSKAVEFSKEKLDP